MATMYEFLSLRPESAQPGKLKSTTDWEEPQVESRDYVLPVRSGHRATVVRSQRSKGRNCVLKDDAREKASNNNSRNGNYQDEEDTSSTLVTQMVSLRHRHRDETASELQSVSEQDNEETGIHTNNHNDETKSIGSSCLRPEPARDIADFGDQEYVKLLYEKKCEKCGLVPMGMFLRQVGEDKLDLHFNAIGNIGMKSLAAPIAMSPGLTKINLSTTIIGDEGIFYLIQGLLTKEGIRELDISYNNISHKGGTSVCELIKRSKSLRSLNISGNNLGDRFAPSLADALQETNLLAELNLADTGLGIEAGRHLGPALAINDTVSDLNLSWNHIRLHGAVAIADGLKKNMGLLKLDISWNGFSLDGSTALGEALTKNSTLTHLDMSNNRLFDKGALQIMKGLQKNQALEILIINANPITAEGALGLLTAIEKNTSTSMQKVEMQGVPTSPEFLQKIKDLQEKNPEFQVIYEMTWDAEERKTALDILFEYLYDEKKSLQDIFGLTEVGSELFMNKGAFMQQVLDAETPLTETQITEISNVLARKDGNVLALGYLFQRWEGYKDERTTELK